MSERAPLSELPLFAASEAEASKLEALERVERNNARWIDEVALPALYRVAGRKPFLTSMDVWEEIGEGNEGREPRALGAVMRAGALSFLLVATPEYRKSGTARNHNRPVRVWRSLVATGHP